MTIYIIIKLNTIIINMVVIYKMLKGKILKSFNGYVLKIECNNKKELIEYCKKHKIDYIDKSSYNF